MQMRIVKKSTVDGGYGKLKWLIDISEVVYKVLRS
jgi:hypothetical protein